MLRECFNDLAKKHNYDCDFDTMISKEWFSYNFAMKYPQFVYGHNSME